MRLPCSLLRVGYAGTFRALRVLDAGMGFGVVEVEAAVEVVPALDVDSEVDGLTEVSVLGAGKASAEGVASGTASKRPIEQAMARTGVVEGFMKRRSLHSRVSWHHTTYVREAARCEARCLIQQ